MLLKTCDILAKNVYHRFCFAIESGPMVRYRLLIIKAAMLFSMTSWNIMNAQLEQTKTEKPAQAIFYYQDGKLVQEINPELGKLTFFYTNPIGRCIRQFMKLRTFSKIVGCYYDSKRSIRSIEPFIKQYALDMSEYEETTYATFNDFFARKLKANARTVDTRSSVVASPCDGKLFVIPNISNTMTFYLKDLPFNLEKFVGDAQRAQQYEGGTLMIFRLAPYDYHRFHFPVDCTPSQAVIINGTLESVNPVAYKSGIQVLTENERHLIELKTQDHGTALMLPVGAMCVGKITETYTAEEAVQKGAESGFFSFGGSTIVLLFPPGKIKLADEFIKHSALGLETAVKMGEPVADFQERL